MLHSEELVGQWREQQATQQPLKLALVVPAREVFSQAAPDARRGQRIEALKSRPGIQLIEGPIIRPGGNMGALAADLKIAGAGAAELHFGNYGCEHEVAVLAKELRVPVLLHAPYDGLPNADGTRDTDSWCGLQPASKLMGDWGIPYHHIPHSMPGSQMEQVSFGRFVAMARAVRNMTNVRCGQIGPNQPTFEAIGCSPEVLSARFGVEMVDIALPTFTGRILELEGAEQAMLQAEVEALGKRIDLSDVPEDNRMRIAAAIIAELELCLEHRLDGLTHRCWPEVMEDHQLMLCLVSSELLRLGVPVACENDRGGLLSVMMLQGLDPEGAPPMFADITIAICHNGKWIILVWHCGPFPSSVCGKCRACQGWIIPTERPAWAHLDGVVQADNATLARLCNRNTEEGVEFSLAAFEAPIVEGPKTLGTHFWVAPGDFHRLERQLVLGDGKTPKATVHHFGVCLQRHTDLVADVARQLQIPVRILEPGEDEILNRQVCAGLNPLVE